MPKPRKYTKEFLAPIVKTAKSMTNLLQLLGLSPSGGSFRGISQRVKEYELDTSHFIGQGWASGKTKHDNKSIKEVSDKTRTPDSEVFKENSWFPSFRLYKRLLELGHDPICLICGLRDWNNSPIRLHVDHINGNHTDNRLTND